MWFYNHQPTRILLLKPWHLLLHYTQVRKYCHWTIENWCCVTWLTNHVQLSGNWSRRQPESRSIVSDCQQCVAQASHFVMVLCILLGFGNVMYIDLIADHLRPFMLVIFLSSGSLFQQNNTPHNHLVCRSH